MAPVYPHVTRGQAIFYSIADSPLGVKESIQEPTEGISRDVKHMNTWNLSTQSKPARTLAESCLECARHLG